MTSAAGGAELPFQALGIAPGLYLLGRHCRRGAQAKQRMRGNGVSGDGHGQSTVGADGDEEGLLSVLEVTRQGAIGESGTIIRIDRPGHDARTHGHEQIATAQPPRRGRPSGIESQSDDLALDHPARRADDDAGEVLECPREDRLAGEWEMCGRTEVEMELEMIHDSILVQCARLVPQSLSSSDGCAYDEN